ncbi:hypothetical protein ACVWZZ_008778 [Bradyrhizobium sp. LM6.10]
MTNLGNIATGIIDPSTSFCAHTYYAGLRAKGCDPVVYKGGLHWLVGESSTGNLNAWAAHQDLDGSLRLEHARATWAERASDDDVILLGVHQ